MGPGARLTRPRAGPAPDTCGAGPGPEGAPSRGRSFERPLHGVPFVCARTRADRSGHARPAEWCVRTGRCEEDASSVVYRRNVARPVASEDEEVLGPMRCFEAFLAKGLRSSAESNGSASSRRSARSTCARPTRVPPRSASDRSARASSRTSSFSTFSTGIHAPSPARSSAAWVCARSGSGASGSGHTERARLPTSDSTARGVSQHPAGRPTTRCRGLRRTLRGRGRSLCAAPGG